MLDIDTLKTVARSIMPYGANRVAVKPINVEIKKEYYYHPTGGSSAYVPYEFILPKEEGILYYPLVPFVHILRHSGGSTPTIFERFIFAPAVKNNTVYNPEFPIADMHFNATSGRESNGSDAFFKNGGLFPFETIITAPRFVDSMIFKYHPDIAGAPPSVGVGVGNYPILKFVVE